MSENKFKNIGSYKDYASSNHGDIPESLFNKYYNDVKSEMINLLIDDKISFENATDFVTSLLNLGEKRQEEIKNKVSFYYIKKANAKECAKSIIEKYYRITVFNAYDDDSKHEEITESYYHYKSVSTSLLWNYIRILNDLKIKFIFNTSIISNTENSLNTENYILFMKSDDVDKQDVIEEFSYSRIFSKIIKYISDENNEFIKFFIGITEKNILNFGYIINEKIYIIGSINYKSEDIKKLSPYIECSDSSISISTLSNKIKTKLYVLNHLKFTFKNILKNYIDTNVYVTVINNNFTVMIELDDEDIINMKYINNVINSNKYRYELNVSKMIKDKIYYGINFK